MTKTETHTPGPWKIVESLQGPQTYIVSEVLANQGGVAGMGGLGCIGEVYARGNGDASLMAAAPDLLAAARELDAHLMRGGKMHQGHALHVTLRAAIARAEGGK